MAKRKKNHIAATLSSPNNIKPTGTYGQSDTVTTSLNLLTAPSAGRAEDGNRLPAFLTISVTDIDGEPIIDVKKRDFRLTNLISPTGGAELRITTVGPENYYGYYNLNLKPIRTIKWKTGTHVIGLDTEIGGKKTRTLFRLDIP